MLDERSALNPVSLYAQTKIDSERVLQALNDNSFAPVILRFATVYGLSYRPRFDLVINFLTAKAAYDKSITIFGGDQWRPFVHVADVAEAILKYLEAPIHVVQGQCFNVGSDEQNYKSGQLGDLIKRHFPQVANILYPFFLLGPKAQVGHAHNLFLQVGVDLGLPGLLAYLALLGLSLWMAADVYRRSRQMEWATLAEGPRRFWELAGPLAAGLLGSYAALIVHGLLDAATWGNKPAVLVWVLFGLTASLWQLSQREASSLD